MNLRASRRRAAVDYSRGLRGCSQLVNVISDAVSETKPLVRGKSRFSWLEQVAYIMLTLARNSLAKSLVETRVGRINSANISQLMSHLSAI